MDSAGNNHGTLMGGVGFTQGAVGQGFLLDGANDFIRIPDSISLHLTNELTVEMWFKRADAASYGALIDKRNWTTCNFGIIMSGLWGFQLYYNDPSNGGQFEISFSSLPSPGVFHHVAGTYRQIDSSHVELKTYLDGQLVRTDTLPGNLANTFNGDALSLGVDRDGHGGSFFRGVIDEVAIYNYALSPSQILSNYSSVTVLPPPPTPPAATNSVGSLVAVWHGESNAMDSAGNNHGTLMGGVGFTQGAVGQGFLLDGANDFIRIPDSISLHLTNELTVEMWFKRADAASYGALIDKRNWTTCNFGIIMSGLWGFQLYYNDPSNGGQFEISFSSLPSPGVFHHVAGTYRQIDSSHVELKTYLDGQLVRTDTLPGNLANTFNGDALSLGVDRDGHGGSFFRGVIDEVAIYNYALSPSQILSNYSSVTISAPQIVMQPASLAIAQGQTATFSVSAVGAALLSYQWRFGSVDLVGQTNQELIIATAQSADAGHYDVVIVNASGSVTSAVAALTVSGAGLPPSFTSAPAAVTSISAGSTLALHAVVAGTPPFAYQWFYEGIALPEATAGTLTLSNAQPQNGGVYRLVVTNTFGVIVSPGSVVNVPETGSGGTIHFANSASNRVFDVDRLTGVPAGAGFVATLHAGSASNALTAVAGGPAAFITPGRFLGGIRTLPSVPPGQMAFVQVRVWDSAVAATYDEALALGARRGESPVFNVMLGGGVIPPASIYTMPSFALNAGTGVQSRRGVQLTSTAPTRIEGFSRSAAGVSFVVSGPPGAAFAIEVSSDLSNWTLLEHVVNNTGALKFNDAAAVSQATRFYRARLVGP